MLLSQFLGRRSCMPELFWWWKMTGTLVGSCLELPSHQPKRRTKFQLQCSVDVVSMLRNSMEVCLSKKMLYVELRRLLYSFLPVIFPTQGINGKHVVQETELSLYLSSRLDSRNHRGRPYSRDMVWIQRFYARKTEDLHMWYAGCDYLLYGT